MAKQTHVNVGGTWRSVKSVWQNVNGVWKKDVMPKLNVSGVYKECMSYWQGRLYIATDYGNSPSRAVAEINISNYSIITSVESPFSNPYRIDGMEGRVFASRESSTYGYELNKDSLAVINSVSGVTSSDLFTIGGVSNQLFCSDGTNYLRELNPDTLAMINYKSFTSGDPYADFDAVGGTYDRLYAFEEDGEIQELNWDEGVMINSIITSAADVGGIVSRLYSCSTSAIYERDLNSLSIIDSHSVSYELNGVGGLK
jgi:hypothetical protein